MKFLCYIMIIIAMALLMVGCNETNEEVKEVVSSGETEVVTVEVPERKEPLTKTETFLALIRYCYATYEYTPDSTNMSLEITGETDEEFQATFRSYTGAYVYFYVDKETGVARMVESVPDLNVEEEAGTIDLDDYLKE